MSVKSLWGEIPSAETIRTPYTILREQAAFLGELTDHVLEGRVRRMRVEGYITPASASFAFVMEIVARAIDDYAFRALFVTYPVTLYPVSLQDLSSEEGYECENEDVFVEHLGMILSSDRVRKVVQGLLSHSMAMAESS